MPKISVIIPNYNYAIYLKQRIESVINQTYQDFEVIILDDHSTDNSKSIIEEYKNHPKIKKIVYYEANSGSPFIQWNKGIEYATGEWIWIAEADDYADKHFLEKVIKNGIESNDIVISYCQSLKTDSMGNIAGSWNDWTKDLGCIFDNNFIIDGLSYIEKFLYFKNTIPNASGVIFRKKAFIEVGRTDIDVKYCADWLLWLKLLTIGKLAFCAENLNYFRDHQLSVIASSNREKELFIYKYDIFLRKKFIAFLKTKIHSKKNLGSFLYLVEIFKHQLSIECEAEAIFLRDNGEKRHALYHMIRALKYTNQKKRIFCALLSKILLPKSARHLVKSYLIKKQKKGM
ncbi:glycosyltransferase [Paludibacter sp.]|uniref:glycosyltransferase family 2 protein n=1 Tax=Paludibacter sp. TaxID=1898105 RepID=UPI001352C362|nr:glycosyltransferase [Paludibacter sp.]MTK52600.1 glycosyltransferase [Paludibacter sp.]